MNVSAAFHSQIMSEAEILMNRYISSVEFKDPLSPIISNYTGSITTDNNNIISNLSKQMSGRDRWVESIKSIEIEGETKILEIGPGKVLSGLIRRISNKFDILNVSNISDIEKIKNEF